MKTKTILNVLIAILLCVSSFSSVVSAEAHDEELSDIHTVNISVDQGEDEGNVAITVAFAWDYPGNMTYHWDVDGNQDDAISADEANDFEEELEAMSLEDLQAAHKSHVWDIAFGGAGSSAGGGSAAWVITTTIDTAALVANETVEVTVTLAMEMAVADLTTSDLSVTFGPIGDKDGDGLSLPPWVTTVTVTDGTMWCNTGITRDNGDDLKELETTSSTFAYHDIDEFDFTAVFDDECEDSTGKDDDDKDGVPNNVDQCLTTPDGVAIDTNPDSETYGCEVSDTGCTEGTDTDGDGVDDCDDTCPDTAEDAELVEGGCSADQLPDEEEDWDFSVTFTVDAASYTCDGMTNDSTAADCMTAASVTLAAVADVAAGHPHAWAWELQVAGSAAADQDPANMMLTSQSAFAWVATGCTGDCLTSTVHTVTNLSGALDIGSGDCVYFDGVTPAFGDAWDDLGESSRCFSAEGTYTSGDYTITVGAATDNGTGTTPIGDETMTDEEATPGFGLIAGISAALGAALIVASRRED